LGLLAVSDEAQEFGHIFERNSVSCKLANKTQKLQLFGPKKLFLLICFNTNASPEINPRALRSVNRVTTSLKRFTI
jgi:hypothetical protein